MNVTYHDRESVYFEYCEDRETSVLMVCIEIQRHYRITNKSRWLDFKEERASLALFIPSLWYNSRFLLSFTCKRRVVKLISRYSTYTALHLSRARLHYFSRLRAAVALHFLFLFLFSSRHVFIPSVSFLYLVVRDVLFCSPFTLSHLRASPFPHAYTATSGGHTEGRGEYYSKQDLHFYDAAIFYRRHRQE